MYGHNMIHIQSILEKMPDENFKNKIKGFLKDIENGARDISV